MSTQEELIADEQRSAAYEYLTDVEGYRECADCGELHGPTVELKAMQDGRYISQTCLVAAINEGRIVECSVCEELVWIDQMSKNHPELCTTCDTINAIFHREEMAQ